MSVWLELYQFLSVPGQFGVTRCVIKNFDPVGVAKVEPVSDQGHAEGLVLVLHEYLADLRCVVTVSIAPKGDTVCAFPNCLDPPHRRLGRVVHQRLGWLGLLLGFRNEYIAIRKDLDPARVIQPGGKGIDLQPGCADWKAAIFPTFRNGHLQGHDTLFARIGNVWVGTERLMRG